MNEDEIFADAIEISDDAERQAFIDNACAGNESMRSSLMQLLSLHDCDDGFLEESPIEEIGMDSFTRPGDVIGRYRLLEHIGEGGFGDVWKAEQSSPIKRDVALKLMKPGLDTLQVIKRFELERQTLGIMNHRNIAAVYDAGTTEIGRPYFVMELVEGKSIDQFCDDHRLNLRQRLKLFLQVCRAVQHAHQKGIVHRDIKPSNVLVQESEDGGEAKVIDFGIAKATQEPSSDKLTLTNPGQLVGTPEYMSPEQLMGQADIDTRADVYGLGGVLYKLLTGVPPVDLASHKESGWEEIFRAVREVEAIRPSSRISSLDNPEEVASFRSTDLSALRRGLRDDLDWVVGKTLAKERARRYESVGELAHDIERYLAHLPVEAGPPSFIYQSRKFIRRNLIAVAAGLMITVSVLATAVATTTGMIRIAKEQEKTFEQWQRAETEMTNALLAKQEAEDQRKRALDEADKALQFAEMLEDLIEAAGPGQSTASLTLRDQLGSFAEALPTGLKDYPKMEARLQRTIGKLFLALHKYKEAGPHLKRALELCVQQYGDENMLTMQSRVEWASWLHFRSRIKESDSQLSMALPWLRKQGPTKVLLDALDLLSRVRAAQGDRPERSMLLNEAIEVAGIVLGESHPQSIILQARYGTRVEGRRNILAADQATIEALEKITRLHPDRELDIAAVKLIRCQVLMRKRQIKDAESLFREVIEVNQRVIGGDSLYGVAALTGLARSLRMQGRHEEAIEAAYEAVAKADSGETEVDSKRLTAYELLASLIQDEQPEQALQLRVDALAAHRRMAPDHVDLAPQMRQLGFRLRQFERHDESIDLYRDAIDIQLADKRDSTYLLQCLYELGDLHMELENWEQAVNCFDEAKQHSRYHSPIVQLDYARALIEAGHVDRVEQMLDSPDNTSKPITLAIEARLAMADGHLNEAKGKIRECLNRLKRERNAGRLWFRVMILKCDCMLARKSYETAEEELRQLQQESTRRGYFRTDRRRVMLRLVTLYEKLGDETQLTHWQSMLQSQLAQTM